MVFFGEYDMTVTSGARLVLPKKIREGILGSEFVLTKGYDTCLSGYGTEDWNERSQEFINRSLIDVENLSIRRMIFSGAVYIHLDEQGRFVLPKLLTNYAAIESDVIIAGVGDHFEIWGKTQWEKYLQNIKTEVDTKHVS